VIPDEVLRIGKTAFLERGGLFCGGVGLFENSVNIDSGERGNAVAIFGEDALRKRSRGKVASRGIEVGVERAYCRDLVG